jgi:L,D-transpeptidase ErfK/SrfK
MKDIAETPGSRDSRHFGINAHKTAIYREFMYCISIGAYCMYRTMMTKYAYVYTVAATFLILCLLATVHSRPAWADTRQDTVAELSRLQEYVSSQQMSEEARSADATFALGEHYFQTGDLEQAERFYLLTIQKARIMMSSLPKAAVTATPAPTILPADALPESVQPQSSAAKPVDGHHEAPAPVANTEIPSAPATAPEHPILTREIYTPSLEPDYFSDEVVSEKLVGSTSVYYVVKDDTIRLVAAKLGVSRRHIIRQNNLDEKAYLKIGQKLVYNNRKIVPQRMKNGIVVNIPDRTLYYFKQGKLTISLPVALGVPVKSDKYDWKTPTGKFRITAKMKDPTWHVPPSIQSEMEEQGKEIITSIPPGPTNPLGKYAFKTSLPGILIHSTTKPWSIYSFASHGCIRVYPEQMEEFFKVVAVNTPGEIIYKPVKLAVTEQGRVFLEVHQDVYGKSTGLEQEARHLIEKQNLAGQVDWQKVESIVRRKSGIAEDISL